MVLLGHLIAPFIRAVLWLTRWIPKPRWTAIIGEKQQRAPGAIPIEERLRPGLRPSAEGIDLACIIIGFKNQPGLVEAVESVLRQDVPVEIVVVNTGGGDPQKDLESKGIRVQVINQPEPLYAGAARNLGIAATQAPYVSFLAGDCIAEPGWARCRLREHHMGALAVSTPLTNAFPGNGYARAAYYLLHSARMPGIPPIEKSHYGLSYARTLFKEFGTFREDLPIGEDSEFNRRFMPAVSVKWAKEVRTAHRYPATRRALVADQYERAVREANSLEEFSGIRHDWILAIYGITIACWSWNRVWTAGDRDERRRLVRASPAMACGAVAYSIGGAGSRRRRGTNTGRPPPGRPPLTKQGPKIFALLQCYNDLRFLPGYFENTAGKVDGVVALDDGSDDGSADFLARQPSVLKLIRNPQTDPHVWNEPENRRRLMEAALELQPDWLIGLDADERLERGFRTRLQALIRRADRKKHLAYAVKIRELWNGPNTYRADGIWGKKRRASLFRARRNYALDTRRLHGHWAPIDSLQDGRFPLADLIVYHLRMIDPEDRKARQSRYTALDAERRWQAIGYDYMTDETGLRLKRIRRRREYTSSC